MVPRNRWHRLLLVALAIVPVVSGFTTGPRLLRQSSSSLLFSTLSPTPPASSVPDQDDDDDNDRESPSPLVSKRSASRVVRISFKNNNKDKTKQKLFSDDPLAKTTTTTKANDTALPYGPLSMTIDELTRRLGGRRGRAELVWDCYAIGMDPAHYHGNIVRHLGHDDYESIQRLLPSRRRTQRLGRPALDLLAQVWRQSPVAVPCVEGGVASLVHVAQARDGTTKLLLQLHDGLQVETVIIPWYEHQRSTVCISSQVGCRQACRFCATGQMGLQRQLTSDEILAQFYFAQKVARWQALPRLSNVVFMGMGEPADNGEAVHRAATILTTRELFQLSATKVTVSTVAPTPEAFGQFAQTPCVLAWSVHAARDALRRQLVPTMQKHSVADLKQGLVDALLARPLPLRTTMLEVVLIDQVNDSLETDAPALVDLSRSICDAVSGCKLVVNLIPYNDISNRGLSANNNKIQAYRTPPPSSVQAFQKHLWQHGVYAHVRTTRGDDEWAACGQLATSKRRNKNSQSPQP